MSYPANVKFEGDYLKLNRKIGKIYCRRHRDFEGTIKTVTISKNSDGKYYASVTVDDGLEKPETSTEGKAIGIDLGFTDFAVTSDGSKFDNPRHLAKHQQNLKRKQQKLSWKAKAGKKGTLMKQKFHLWCHQKIVEILNDRWAELGLIVQTINPKYTSAYAFDGSGKVKRNKKNYSLCVFPSGKQYNADLGASYNIGARYWYSVLIGDKYF